MVNHNVPRSLLTRSILSSLLLFVTGITYAQAPTLQRGSRSYDSQHILEHKDRSFAANIDEKSGVPYWIIDVDSISFNTNGTRSLMSEESVKEAADAFVEEYADVFRINPDNLILESITPIGDSIGGWWAINYRQRYNDIPVLNADYGITITQDGQLIALGAHTFPSIDVDTAPGISSAAAIQIAQQRAGLSAIESTRTPELYIVSEELEDRYTFHLAWQLRLEATNPDSLISKDFLVNAHTGEIIAEYDNFSYSANHHTSRLWDSEPSLPIHLYSNDTETPTLNSDTVPIYQEAPSVNSVYGYVKLNYYETPNDPTKPLSRHLDKPFVGTKVTVVNNLTQQTYTTATGPSGYYSISGISSNPYTVTFEIANTTAFIGIGLSTSQKKKGFSIFVNGETRLDYDWNWGSSEDGGLTSYALNAVHHMRDMFYYFKNTQNYSGMDNIDIEVEIRSTGIGATVNEDYIILGGGEAMSSEVSLHEYSHAVIYHIYNGPIRQGQPQGQPYDEAFALDEGIAFFFPTDKTNDHTYGGPQTNADPEAPNGVGIVYLFNPCTMNDFNGGWPCGGDPHSRGRMIGGAIWRMRMSIGVAAAKDLFKAIQIPPLARKYVDLRARLVSADNALHGGTHGSVIEQKFVERYIGGPNAPGSPNINVNGSGIVTINWTDKSAAETGYRVERKFNSGGSWSVISTKPANSTSHTESYHCTGGGSGRYYYRIQAYRQNSGHPDEINYSASNWLDLATCVASQLNPIRPELVLNEDVPHETELLDAYPNPFNPTTTMNYKLAEDGPVRLAVYDVLGREVALLVNEVRTAGAHTVTFNASHLPSGLYIYRLQTASQQLSKTMLLAK